MRFENTPPRRSTVQQTRGARERVSVFRLRMESDAVEEPALLEVPDQVAYLTAPNGTPARLGPKPPRRGPSVLLEAVRVGRRPSLVAIASDGAEVRINGLPGPRVGLLRVGDELALDAATSFRVGEYRERSFEKPSVDVVGRKCSSCRTPIREDQHIYTCGCGEALHWEQPPKPEDDRLVCALLASHCPSCRDGLPSPDGELRWGEPC